MSSPVWNPAVPPGRRRRGGSGRVVLIVGVSVACIVGAAFVAWLASRTGDARGATLTLVFATLPVPLVVSAYLWLDRYEPEPTRFLVAAVVWGGVVAVGVALPIEVAFAKVAHVDLQHMATFVAPLTEEPAKALFLLLVMVHRRREITSVTDGLVYAGLVGIGFAFTENVGYYAGGYAGTLTDRISGAQAATSLFVVRGLFSPFAHSLFASGFGLGMGVALTTKRRWLKRVAPVVGLAIGIALHATWNGSVAMGGVGWFFGTYLGVFLPVFLGLITLAVVLRRRRLRALVVALQDAATRGWLHPDEVSWLSTFSLRRQSRKYVKSHDGPAAADVLREYQQVASEMGFLHLRELSGPTRPGLQRRIGECRAEMAWLRPRLRMPPPRRTLPFGVLALADKVPPGWAFQPPPQVGWAAQAGPPLPSTHARRRDEEASQS
ncbi:MAG: PrsW family intramembrane metalloprotease [Nocardioidaceae bacterium]